jgi:Uri superfamily endonuclease
LTATQLPPYIPWISYSLFIKVKKTQTITVGRFGRFEFISANYIYSGSARQNFLARINRHLRKEKKLRWHVQSVNKETMKLVKTKELLQKD